MVYRASELHGTADAQSAPVASRRKTVPLNRTTMGAPPSTSARKYLAVAMHMSNVHGTRTSKQPSCSNGGTTAVARVHKRRFAARLLIDASPEGSVGASASRRAAASIWIWQRRSAEIGRAHV